MFDIQTVRLVSPEKQVVPHSAVETDYAQAYRIIYKTAPQKVSIPELQADAISEAADEHNCTVLELCLIVMSMWLKTQPERRFHPRNLTTDHAHKVVKMAGLASISKHAGLCSRSVSEYAGVEYESMKSRLLTSEIMFGGTLVGRAIKEGSGKTCVTDVLKKLEFQLDPSWLALEDSYADLFASTMSDMESLALSSHRRSVARRKKEYIADPRARAAVFATRSGVMLDAANTVLSHYGISPDDIEVPDRPITDAALFWKKVAHPITHLMAHRIYDDASVKMRF